MPPDADVADSVDPEMLRVMALLVASYSWEHIDERTPEAYAIQLADLPLAEVRVAVLTLNATPGRRRIPSVGEIRGAVVERRLELPEPVEAWEWAARAASTPLEYESCPFCNATGLTDLDAGTRCDDCKGTGDREAARAPIVRAMPEPLRRAFRAVGGASGIAEGKTEVVRAQFLRAYESIARRALTEASLGSAGLELPRRTIHSLPRGDR